MIDRNQFRPALTPGVGGVGEEERRRRKRRLTIPEAEVEFGASVDFSQVPLGAIIEVEEGENGVGPTFRALGVPATTEAQVEAEIEAELIGLEGELPTLPTVAPEDVPVLLGTEALPITQEDITQAIQAIFPELLEEPVSFIEPEALEEIEPTPETAIQRLEQRAEEDTQGFLRTIFEAGRGPETELLLTRMFGQTLEEVTQFFTPTFEELEEAVKEAFPGRTVDEVLEMADTDLPGFIDKLRKGGSTAGKRLLLKRMGFTQAPSVMEPGDYAVRGGIMDVWPPGDSGPVRLDFFGDVLDGARRFDPASQRTTEKLKTIDLAPVSEVILDEAAITRFRQNYRVEFGAAGTDDPLYEAVSAGRKHAGIEHWLPFFHEDLETLFNYMPEATICLDDQVTPSRLSRWEGITDQYDNRREAMTSKKRLDTVYKPAPPGLLYLDDAAWDAAVAGHRVVQFHPLPQ
ncbi:hypothetical protein LCGC14_1905220, partial [marine sediment metagenome]